MMMRARSLLTTLTRTCLSFYLLLSMGIAPPALAKVACNETSMCEVALRAGSTCTDGYCTNPFATGCLNRMMGDEKYPKIRTCNSEDGPDAVCAPSPLDYEEIRIAPNNWESAMFYAWILQILLSEVLDVPATIDTGPGGGALSFYDEQNGFAYPKKANNFDALYKANEVGDCRETDEPCAHFISEMWQGKRVLNESAVEREGNGMVGHVGWFVPKFAANVDASVTHYLGLTGDKNRQKLADMFKRPLRWTDYCTQVSSDNCTTKDDVSSRAPVDMDEGEKYFVRGSYTGHFIATDKNDCTTNPNCTGHMIDYPCTWSAYTAAQLYWNDIPLESDTPDGTNSYKYGAMLQIIDASNATNSPIIIVWWYPDPTMDMYEFTKVTLPETSRECLTTRPEAKPNRCDAPRDVLIGQESGACGYNTHTLEKYFARSFRERSVETPLAIRSPGHQLVRNTQLSDIDLSEMMVVWASRGVDKWNYDPREAVCEWVANNFDDGLNLKYFIPPGYPRLIEEEAGYNSGLMYFSNAFGAMGAIVAIAACGATYRFRGEKQIKFAQEFFLYLFGLGFFLICIGSIMYGLVPSKATCNARWWFVVIGFTFALVPLLIKIAAINKLMNDARKMRRTNVSKELVYKIVAGVVLLVVIYLSLWTGIDPSVPESNLVLRTETGSTVDVHIQCASKRMAWEIIAFGWEAVLICSAAAVAFLSRKIRQAFNESRVVGNVAYTMFFFLVFRLLVFFMPDSILQPSLKNGITSLLLAFESLVCIGLYIGNKFLSIYQGKDDNERGGASIDTVQSVLFNSSGKTEICPLCERPMPTKDKNEQKKNDTRTACGRTRMESTEIELQSTNDIEAAAPVGRVSDLTVGPSNRTEVACGAHCVSFQDSASQVLSSVPGGAKQSVLGGQSNIANGTKSSGSVGENAAATVDHSSAQGVTDNTATTEHSSAPATSGDAVKEPHSSIAAGEDYTAAVVEHSSVCGDSTGDTVEHSTLQGVTDNVVSGEHSSVPVGSGDAVKEHHSSSVPGGSDNITEVSLPDSNAATLE